MKCMVVLFALVAVAYAGDLGLYSHAPSVYAHAPAVYLRPHIGSSQYRAQDTLGQFDYAFASGDGTTRSESRDINGNVVGSYGYTSPEGIRIETSYIAGHGGFQAVGNAIPVPVGPTPEVAAATYAHLAAKSEAFHGYVSPVAHYAHPYPYAHHYGYDGYY